MASRHHPYSGSSRLLGLPLELLKLCIPDVVSLARLAIASQHGWDLAKNIFDDNKYLVNILIRDEEQETPTRLSAASRALIVAARKNYITAVTYLTRAPTVRELDIFLALKWACHENNGKVVDILLTVSNLGINTALIVASRRGHVSIMEKLLNHGADVRTMRDAALVEASRIGNGAAVDLLLERGASAANSRALIAASREGHASIIQKLLDHGADIHSNDDAALIAACKTCQQDAVDLLLARGASASAAGSRALIVASRAGHASIIGSLVAREGVDVNVQNGIALTQAILHDHGAAVDALLKGGANPNSGFAMTLACRDGHIDIVRQLCAAGASPQNEVAILVACMRGHAAVIKALHEAGATFLFERQGWTPMAVACQHGHTSVVRVLLSPDNPDDRHSMRNAVTTTFSQDHPLVRAVMTNAIDLVHFFVEELGMGVNHFPAVAIAAKRGYLDMVQYLLGVGADPNKLLQGKTPLTYASEQGHEEIARTIGQKSS